MRTKAMCPSMGSSVHDCAGQACLCIPSSKGLSVFAQRRWRALLPEGWGCAPAAASQARSMLVCALPSNADGGIKRAFHLCTSAVAVADGIHTTTSVLAHPKLMLLHRLLCMCIPVRCT